MEKVCKSCGSDNVIFKRCINCGESYPYYTAPSISKGSNIILFGLPVAAVLFVAVKNSFGNQDGYSDYSDSDLMIIIGSIILAFWILVKRQAKGKL